MVLQRSIVCAACAGAVALVSFAVRAADDPSSEWRFHSGDNGARKYSPLAQIDKDNVATLGIAWRRPHIDPAVAAILPPNLRVPNNFRSTPLMVKGVMYASNGVGLAEAFDPETGRTLWVQKPGSDEVRPGSNRGVAHWRPGADERLFTFRGHPLFALNPRTRAARPPVAQKR